MILKSGDIKKIFRLIEETADFARNERAVFKPGDFDSKSDLSLVTHIDKQSEEKLITGLRKVFTEANFLAEEGFSNVEEADLTWIIDPIDGTTNMVHNVPAYCISVALRHQSKTILGIVYEISRKEFFYAYNGLAGAYLNGNPITVSQTSSVKNSLLGTGFPMTAFDKIDEYMDHFRYFMVNTHGVRRVGSAALDLAYVACGRYDGFFEYNLKPWDVAGGAYIVSKAGGRVTDFNGGNNYIFGKNILASNSQIHGELLKRFETTTE
jgi:myo-inositol-1(or 4)-monophosphatase